MGVYDEEEQGFFQKHPVVIVCGIIAVMVVAVWLAKGRFENSQSRQNQKLVMVDLPPPSSLAPLPPPPTQLPPPPMETEQKMIAQEPVDASESKPTETPASESPAIGTSIQGNGPPDGFGVGQGRSFFGGGKDQTLNGTGGSKYGWYANQVQRTVTQALQNNSYTRNADFRIEVQIWSDRTGRITRAHLKGSTGNVAIDNAITNEVLVGLMLQEPPPDEKTKSIVLQLTARHSTMALSR